MDHLPQPDEDLAHPPLEVPFVCDKEFSYDGNGFLTYPDRAGVDLRELVEREPTDVDALGRFVQAWLWFGLLGELLYVGFRPDSNQRCTSYTNFISIRSGKRLLCTTALFKCVTEAGEKNKSDHKDDSCAKIFNACIGKAREAVKQILSSTARLSDLNPAQHFRDPPTLYTIIFSVQVLIETLEASRHTLLPANIYHANEPLSRPFRSGAIDMRLRDAGWCARDVALLPKSIRLRYFLSLMHPADTCRGVAHSHCTKKICQSRALDEASIKPVHVTSTCHCPEATADSPRVAGILSAGNIPLITYTKATQGHSRQLQISEVAGGQGRSYSYVTISHVRRAGLGNGMTNALPSCQLSRLQELVRDARTSFSVEPLFWIDVMCVPLTGKDHSTGIKLIHEVYKNAGKVLVLDPSLYNYNVASCEEALIRIRYSLWMKRLWTLQEGVLARQLSFKFWNRIITLDELLQQYENADGFPLLQAKQFHTSEISKYLPPVLELFDRDIKTFKARRERDPEYGLGLDHENLYKILRLGYLASPQYRYFVEDHEKEKIEKALDELARVYLDPLEMPLRASQRSEHKFIQGLRNLQKHCIVFKSDVDS